MTTIAIVKKQGQVAIAADSGTTMGSCVVPPANLTRVAKIMRIGRSFVASSGTAVHGLVLESLARRHKDSFQLDSAEQVFETFRALHPVMVEEYYLMTEVDDDDQPFQSSQFNLMIANASGIYEVHHNRDVTEYETFWATGSGYRFALGALDALYAKRTHSAKALARRACEAGVKFDDGSSLPIEVHGARLTR